MKRAEDYLFKFQIVSSNMTPREFVDAEMRRSARLALLDFVVPFHVTQNDASYSRTHSAAVYVVPADEFWRLVQEEAMRLTTYSNRPRLES